MCDFRMWTALGGLVVDGDVGVFVVCERSAVEMSNADVGNGL